MKSLLILRHAEARPAAGGTPDHDRQLTRHGHVQARALGRWLKRRAQQPDRLLCSAATRARQTAEAVVRAAEWATPLHAVERLYNASAGEMLDLVRGQPDSVERLLIVAHAPGVGELTGLLVSRHAHFALLCEPATLIEVAFDIGSWSDAAASRGVLRLVLPPG